MRTIWFAFIAATLALAACETGFASDEQRLATIDEGKLYAKVDDDPILGRDVIDLFVEERWEKALDSFVQHALIVDEIQTAKIVVSDAEVDAELNYILREYAKKLHLNPDEVSPDVLVKKYGLPGGVAVLRRQTRECLGMLRRFQQLKILAEDAHTSSSRFQEALRELLEKRINDKGVIRDPKELGGGEAVRIGGQGYSRPEVRDFIAEAVSQVTEEEFQQKLKSLELERVVQHAMTARKMELSEHDLEFHYSYLCRDKESKPPYAPGKMVMQQTVAAMGMTPQQFIHSRLGKTDASLTKMAAANIGFKDLQDDFAKNPTRYKRNENLVAHLFVRVLDPEGRPYTYQWKIPNNAAINSYVAQRREEQFEATKPKILTFVDAAKADFEAAAKKYSDDSASAPVGGTIGRIGAESILFPPCDVNVRDAAVKLKPGEMSGPVRSDYGWHLLKCLDKQDVTFEEASAVIYANLIHDGKAKLINDLMINAKIEEKP